VEMGRDVIAVRQDKPGKFVWLRFQNRLQFIQFHEGVYIPIKEYSQEVSLS
jgi:hypothetical protein